MSSAYCIQQVTIPQGCVTCGTIPPTYGAPGTPVLHIKDWTDPCSSGWDGYYRYVSEETCLFLNVPVEESLIPGTLVAAVSASAWNFYLATLDIVDVESMFEATGSLPAPVDDLPLCGVEFTTDEFGTCGVFTFELEMAIPP